MIITDVDRIEITQGRWDIRLKVVHSDGAVEEFVASADQHFTGNSRIWFGTVQEYEEYE